MSRGSHSSSKRSSRAAPTADTRSVRRSRQQRGGRLRLPRLGHDPGDRLIASGLVLFAFGLLAIGVTFVPFLTLRRSNTDLAVNLGTFATVLGLALGALGAYRSSRSQQQ